MPNSKVELRIELATSSAHEKQAKEQLERILTKFDLSKWIFTEHIRIKSFTIPHSHPVLTLNTRHLNDDEWAMSTFLHEQIHWFVEQHWDTAKLAIQELRKEYPGLPVGLPAGAKDEDSSYLHLIVNYLEYTALIELVGIERAQTIVSRIDVYTELYSLVVHEADRLKQLFNSYNLLI